MAKIIIVGMPGAGKTTLRKIFFEGNNPSDLLKHSLEPTRGFESTILSIDKFPFDATNIKEELIKEVTFGIFDYAGQENRRWLESESGSVFSDAITILLVLDIAEILTLTEKTITFIKKIIKIRNETCPYAQIYLLFHKIDLVDQQELVKFRVTMNKVLFDEKFLNIEYTSIRKEFFPECFVLFLSIMRSTALRARQLEYEKIIDDLAPKVELRMEEELVRIYKQIDNLQDDLTSQIQLLNNDLNQLKVQLIKAGIRGEDTKFDQISKRLMFLNDWLHNI